MAIGGVGLISAFIQRAGSGGLGAANGIAEWPVQSRRKLRGVGKDAGGDEALGIKGGADGGDPAVHHVGRGDEVGPRFTQNSRLFTKKANGGVVIDVATFFIEDAVVAVGGVGIESHIGKDREIGEFFFEGAKSAGNEAFGIQAGFAVLGAEGRFDAGEDGDTADAALGESGRMAKEGGNGVTKMAGEAGDRGGCAGAVLDEKRGDEMGSGDGGLGKQSPDAGGAAKAATSDWNGKLGAQGRKIISTAFGG